MSVQQNAQARRPYVCPQLKVTGDIAALTQMWGGKSWGSGDSIISSITDNDVIINIVDSVTHVS
jgi:hypothetical protein